MNCKRCGAPLEQDQRFCARCGTPVTAPEAQPAYAAPAAEPAAEPTWAAPAGAPADPPPPAAPRRRRLGLWMGVAGGVVAALVLLALTLPALLRTVSPEAYLFDSLQNTAAALADERETLYRNLGLDLPREKSDTTLHLQLDELSAAGPEAALLQGLGLTLRTQTDLPARQMQYTLGLKMAGLELLSADAWLDEQKLALRSAELTGGQWYGIGAQQFGAQVNRLLGEGTVDPAMQLNPFDAAQSAAQEGSPLAPETIDALWEAARALLNEAQIERHRGETVNAQGQDRTLDRVTAAVSRQAVTDWLNASADALLADPYAAELLAADTTEEEFRQALTQAAAELPETIQLEFLVQNGRAVRFSLFGEEGRELRLELGMDGVLLDVMAVQALEADGTQALAFELTGAHTAPGGHLTSSGRMNSASDQSSMTFMLDLDAKQAGDNLTAELSVVDGWGSTLRLTAQGSWLADPDAHTLTVDLARLALDADGSALVCSGKLAVAPAETLAGPESEPQLLEDMTDEQLADLMMTLQTNLQLLAYQTLLGLSM